MVLPSGGAQDEKVLPGGSGDRSSLAMTELVTGERAGVEVVPRVESSAGDAAGLFQLVIFVLWLT